MYIIYDKRIKGIPALGKMCIHICARWKEFGLRRLENGYFEGNTSSYKLQERFGYKIEGMRRKGLICLADGKVKDEYITLLLCLALWGQYY